MKDTIWVLRTFGVVAGIRFAINTLERKVRKLLQ